MLTNSEWLSINDVTLLIHGTERCRDMQQYFLEGLRNIIPYERSAFFLFYEEGQKLILSDPVCINIDPGLVQRYGEMINTNSLCRRVISLRRTMAYRSSDLVTPDEKATAMVAEARNEYLIPNDVVFYSGIALADTNKNLLGEVILYRTEGQRDFTDEELEILDCLKDHLAIRLWWERHMKQCSAVLPDDGPSLVSLGLTARESEIAALVAQQYSTEEISRKLVISPYTTKKHLHHIFVKLGVHNRMQLIESIRRLQQERH